MINSYFAGHNVMADLSVSRDIQLYSSRSAMVG